MEEQRPRRMMTPEERPAVMARLRERFDAKRPKWEEVERRLIEAVPETRYLSEMMRRHLSELLIYPLFEDALWPHTLLRLELDDDPDQLNRIFAFIEELALDADHDLRDLAAIGFIEHTFGDGASGLAWPLMRNTSRAFWLDGAMARVYGSDDLELDTKYKSQWLQEVAAMGGPSHVDIRSVFELRERLIPEFPEPPGFFRSDFRNWDVYSFVKLEDYRQRLKEALGRIGSSDDWYSWLSKLKDARTVLLNDPGLQR